MPTSRTPKKLATLYAYLRREAERTETDRRADLFNGARLAVRVVAGVVTLTVQRKHKPVGATEITTFLHYCQVPATAKRIPEKDQGQRTDDAGVVWYYVAWRWSIAEELSQESLPEANPQREIDTATP